MRARPPEQGPEIRLVAIHADQRRILIDQSGATIQLPPVPVPYPFSVPGQPVAARFAGLVEEKFALKGEVLALTGTGGDGALFVVYYARHVPAGGELDRKGLGWRDLTVAGELLDSGAAGPVQHAANLVRAHRIADDLKDAWSVRRGHLAELLRERLSTEEGLAGWNQLLSADGSPGVLSTAQGILAFLEAGVPFEGIGENIETLRKLRNDDGGWPIRKALIGHSDRSITESTVYCLWALSASGQDLRDDAIVSGIEWLERAQLRDGGWGSTEAASRARTYPTAFAARYLVWVTRNSGAVRRAATWLREAQNDDGGWGPLRSMDSGTGKGSSTPLHTAHALLGLLAAGADRDDQAVGDGVAYLRSSFRGVADPEPWPSTSEVETVEDDAVLDFRHFTAPWVICALLKCGVSLSDPMVSGSVQWLLAEQSSLGYWSSSLTPGQSPIWASFDAVHAIKEIREEALARIPELLAADARAGQTELAWRRYFTELDAARRDARWNGRARNRLLYVWNGVLTFAVALILVYQVTPVSAGMSDAWKIIGSALLGLVPGFGPFVYNFILDRIRAIQKHK